MTTLPTTQGFARYPQSEGCHPDLELADAHPDHELPCTCTDVCPPRCAGACGCSACSIAFSIYCEEGELVDASGYVMPEEMIVARYRATASR